jgi:2-oxoacid:acceptor oxidoreductase gamma subunit (pyruvate/2-ketoisovalerate family)
VLDPTLLGTVPVAEGLKDDGSLVVNSQMSPDEVREITGYEKGKVFTVDASHIAIEEMGREITNTPMLGAFAKATGLVDIDHLAEEVRDWFSAKLSKKIVDANVRALKRAAEELVAG